MNLATAIRRIDALNISADQKKDFHDQLLKASDAERENIVTKAYRAGRGNGPVPTQTKIGKIPSIL